MFSLFLAAALSPLPAAAPGPGYRLLMANPRVATMATAIVTGPEEARELTAILLQGEPYPDGVDNVVMALVVNCSNGTYVTTHIASHRGDTQVSERHETSQVMTPAQGSSFWKRVHYACTGDSVGDDETVIPGLSAARTYGFRAIRAAHD